MRTVTRASCDYKYCDATTEDTTFRLLGTLDVSHLREALGRCLFKLQRRLGRRPAMIAQIPSVTVRRTQPWVFMLELLRWMCV